MTSRTFGQIGIALSGTFPGNPQDTLKKLIKDLGATFKTSVTSRCTHLVTNESAIQQNTHKYQQASRLDGCAIVSLDWLMDSKLKNEPLPEEAYLLSSETNSNPSQSTKKKQAKNTKTRKNSGSTENAMIKGTGTKCGVDRLNNRSYKSSLNGGQPDPDKPISTHLQVPVSGAFLHDIYKLIYSAVLVSEDGVPLDANLSQTVNNIEEFYRIQVIFTNYFGNDHTFWVWTHWGRRDKKGESFSHEAGSLRDAVHAFETEFSQKTGLRWSNREKSAKKGKYRFLIPSHPEDENTRDRAPPINCEYVSPAKPIIKSTGVSVPVIRDLAARHKTLDNDSDGHCIVTPGDLLIDRYLIIDALGQGAFGKVFEAYDQQQESRCAVKIIRYNPKDRNNSLEELRVLSTLASNDKSNRNRCIHFRDCFDFRNQICIVTDLLGQSLFDFQEENDFLPFPSSQIQHFARQLFTSVAFLHDLNLVHTDLKPENILTVSNAYQVFTFNQIIPSFVDAHRRVAQDRRVLLDSEIRLIDFGSAIFDDEKENSSVVSTHPFRAPEIILNLEWSFPCDIWSIGCILVELFTGEQLFFTDGDLSHLAMMQAIIGTEIDSSIVQQVVHDQAGSDNSLADDSRHRAILKSPQHNPAAEYFHQGKLNFPNDKTTTMSRMLVKAMKSLTDFIPANTPFNRHFLDLLQRIFVYDPKNRITAKEALKHPWFKESLIDDGTEASRIGMGLHRQGRG